MCVCACVLINEKDQIKHSIKCLQILFHLNFYRYKKGYSVKCNSVSFIGGTLFRAPSVGLGRSGCFPETGQTAACSHSVGLVHSKTGSKI